MTFVTRSRFDPRDILRVTAGFYRKQLSEIRGRDRRKSAVIPRHVAMYLIRKHTDLTLGEIGVLFGRDHTTVLHAHTTTSAALLTDELLRRQIEIIEQDLEPEDPELLIENLVGLA